MLLQRMNLWTTFFQWFQFIGTTCLGLAPLYFSYIGEDVFITIILFLSGFFMLGYAIFNYRKISQNIAILVETYPELDGDYLDEDLRLLIYGEHLFSYPYFELVDLNDCRRFSYREGNARFGPYLVARTRKGKNHFFKLEGNGTYASIKQDCLDLCDYVGGLHPHIDIDV